MTHEQKAGRRLLELDLLRFLAAMSVVMYHYAFRGYAADQMTVMPYPSLAQVAKYGHYGVELFFMISGFVILMSATNSTVWRFAIARAVRLYPAFWICCTLTFLVTTWIGAPRYGASTGQFLANLTLAGGLLGAQPMDGVYWSIFIEIRFYLLVALVLLVKKIDNAEALLASWLVITIALEVWPIGKLRFLFLTDYASHFISGAVFFHVWKNGTKPRYLAMIAVAWLLAIQHALKGIATFEAKYQTEVSEVVVVALISSFYGCFFLTATDRTGALSKINCTTLGATTYPLYLIHQNMGYMTFNVLYPSYDMHTVLWSTTASMLALAFTISALLEPRIAHALRRLLTLMFARRLAVTVPAPQAEVTQHQ